MLFRLQPHESIFDNRAFLSRRKKGAKSREEQIKREKERERNDWKSSSTVTTCKKDHRPHLKWPPSKGKKQTVVFWWLRERNRGLLWRRRRSGVRLFYLEDLQLLSPPSPWPTSPPDCPWIRTVISFGISFHVQPRDIIVRLFRRARVLRDFPLRHPHNFSPRTRPSFSSSPSPRNDVLNSQRKTGRIFVENSESRRYEECGYRVVLPQFTDIILRGTGGRERERGIEGWKIARLS